MVSTSTAHDPKLARQLVLDELFDLSLYRVVSKVLSFLSGMDINRRITLNLVILTVAVSVSYGIGLAAKNFWGISI